MTSTTIKKKKTPTNRVFDQIEACVDAVIEKVGTEIRLGITLGAVKPNQFVNSLYQRAKTNPEIKLTIYTALTLEKPAGESLLEQRFMGPFAERVFEDYPDLDYEHDRTRGLLPSNVRVVEFYFPAGKYMHDQQAQRDYVSSNYTHIARDLIDQDINVIAQMVAKSEDGKHLSLSCNPDVTLDVMRAIRDRRSVFVAQVNNNLPYMYGDAVVPLDTFHFMIDNPVYDFKIFGPPKTSIPDVDFMIGLHASTLVKDGGELQIGIGSLSDALIYALLLRQLENPLYRELLERTEIDGKFGDIIARKGSRKVFEAGLFGASEMFVDGFMELIKEGILKRKVYDDVHIQRLLNEGLIRAEDIDIDTLYHLLRRGAIQPVLRSTDFDYLQHFGILRPELSYKDGYIYFPDDTKIEADLNNDHAHEVLIEQGLGRALQNGAIVHGGFFLGSNAFYDWLRQLPEEERRLIHMKSVKSINQLYGHEELDRLHRKDARFFNTCFVMTLLGAAASDALEDGRVVSGVGGQYNFVEMAHALPDGHSVLQLRSTRKSKGKVRSNIVWQYGHVTIPRHLRDIVITEYGIADIRGKTDEEVIKALIQIADSRFQPELIRKAKQAGKLSKDYQIPAQFAGNYPKRYEELLTKYKGDGYFPTFPFGTDLTDEELVLGKALTRLKAKTATTSGLISAILKALFMGKPTNQEEQLLERMQLDKTKGLMEWLYRKLLIAELR